MAGAKKVEHSTDRPSYGSQDNPRYTESKNDSGLSFSVGHKPRPKSGD